MPDEPVQDEQQSDDESPKQGLVSRLKAAIPRVSTAPLRGVRDSWQIPALLVAGALIVTAMMSYIKETPGADFPGALNAVEQHLEARQYPRAMGILNGPILSNLEDPLITSDDLARFWSLRADTLYLLARAEGIDRSENHTTILDNYRVARQTYDHDPSPEQRYRFANTMLAMDRFEAAAEEAFKIPDELADRRREVFRRVVEHGLRTEATDEETARAFDLLSRLRLDPTTTEEDRLWAVTRQARLSLETGHPEDALRRLLPELQRMESRLSEEAGTLLALLGEAYVDLGIYEDARRQLELALQVLDPVDPVTGRTNVLLGRIDRVEGFTEEARDRFRLVAERYPTHPVGVSGWLGVAECEADLGDFDQSRMAYQQVILGLDRAQRTGDLTVDRVHNSIAQRHDQRVAADDVVGALRFAALVPRLYPGKQLPAEAVRRLASAHRAVADELMATQPLTPEGVVDLSEADPATLEQARQHFSNSAEHSREFARLTLLGDPEVSRDALWSAADSYDHAGDLEMATQLFGEFVEATHDDPRQLEGRFRLGKAWLGRGGYDNAVAFFEDLITENGSSKEAYRSFVPLARAYLLASDWRDHDRAERLLLRVLDGETFSPDAPEYRSGLLELGALYRRIGRYTEAIERTLEAADRYPDLMDDAGFVFQLADAHRLEAGSIGERLREAMPSGERIRLESLRGSRLDRAAELYEASRAELLAEDERRRSPLEEDMIRNALIYLADCAYDKAGLIVLRDPEGSERLYREAIRRYDNAAQRYGDDPSSLSAMMQVVNCYAAIGDLQAARIAHDRARTRLAELPESAFERTSSPFNRTQWEKWLDSAVELDRFADAGE